MRVGVRLTEPALRVAEPVAAILLILVSEPGNFVIAPNPNAAGAGLARLFADAPVVDLHQVRQVVAFPAAKSRAPFAPPVDAVGKTFLENRFLRLVGNLHDAQRE